MWSVGLSYMAFIMLKYILNIKNGWWTSSTATFYSVDVTRRFLFQFVNIVYHLDCFVSTEPSLIPWGKSYLIMLYDPFNALLDLVCWYFVEFCIYVHQWYWLVIFFFVCDVFVWFWYQIDDGLVQWVKSISSSTSFWKSFRKIGISSLNVW